MREFGIPMEHIKIREYLESDFHHLSDNLREVDRKELEALFDLEAASGLLYSIQNSDDIWVATHFGLPVMIFGVSDRTEEKEEDRCGIIWAVGTDEVYKHRKALHSISRKVINRWLEEYDVLFNYIWEDAEDHRKWLEAMGFIFFEEEYIISPADEKFIYFVNMPHNLDEE